MKNAQNRADCATIRYLRQLPSSACESEQTLKDVAAAALAIVSDIRAEGMTDTDVECLHDLVDSIYREGNQSLLAHLQEGAADCAICAAIKARIRQLPR